MNIEEDLKSLDVLQISILFWKMRGLNNEEIGKKFGNGEDWTKARMTEIYESLGFDRQMHSKEKNRILTTDYLPVVKLLTNDDPDTLKDWPLNAKQVKKTVDQPPQNDRPSVAQTSTPVDQTTLSPRASWWRTFLGCLIFVCIFLVAVTGVGFVLYRYFQGQQTATPEPTQGITNTIPATSALIPTQPIPTSIVPSESAPAPAITATPEFYTEGQAVVLKDGVVAILQDEFNDRSSGSCLPPQPGFGVTIEIHNTSGSQFNLRFDATAFSAVDNLGNEYELTGSGIFECYATFGIQEKLINNGVEDFIRLQFAGQFPLDAQYLTITADSISGVKVVFRKAIY